MTEPIIIISFDDLVKHKDKLFNLQFEYAAAKELYDSIVDGTHELHEDPIEIKGVKIVIIQPEGQQNISNVFSMLKDLKVEYQSSY